MKIVVTSVLVDDQEKAARTTRRRTRPGPALMRTVYPRPLALPWALRALRTRQLS